MLARTRQRWTNLGLLLAATGFVLLPSANAQKFGGRIAAKVLLESGQVSVLRDAYPVALNVNDPILVQQTVVTGPQSYARFQLEDNTTIELFENSRMVFHGNTPSVLDMLYIELGRLKIFEQHTKGENAKKVTTPTAVISVRGTVYDVVVEDNDGTTLVTVDEGAVEVTNHTSPGPGVLLNPGDWIRVFRGQPLVATRQGNGVFLRAALKAARDAWNQVLLGRANTPGGLPGGGGATVPGAPGDKKSPNGGGTGTGSTNGAPPPPTGAPPTSGGH
jgi:ferric-dicitrate binding protein FerR (iron transport regulator)